jgi:16S rRNA (cytosine967-C5)-methyltransferase
MISPARVATVDILLAVSAGRADLPTAIASARASLHDERDRALAAEIATGVQRWRAALDHVIVHLSRRQIDRLDPEILEILRSSVYQLLYLTRVPAAAIVDDAVNLTKRVGKTSAGGLVNAVLRSVSRKRASLPLPPRPSDPGDRARALEYLSVALSHPRWLVARWYDRLGFDRAEAWLRFDNSAAPLTLRANRFRMTPGDLAERLAGLDVVVSPGRYVPDALVVEKGHPLRGTGVEEGWFVVQDEASQLVSLLCGPEPGPLVLDTCAAPGGKTTAIAAAAGEAARVIACDVRGRRMDLLRRTTTATGARNVRLVQADLLAALPFGPVFDTVIVDAPCSGLGTLRRDPDIRWRRREADLTTLSASQRRMLVHASQTVAAGGRLIYATCSSEPEENEEVAEAFLAASPEFAAVNAAGVHPSLPGTVVDGRGHLRTTPDRHGLEGFFGAVFERRGGMTRDL